MLNKSNDTLCKGCFTFDEIHGKCVIKDYNNECPCASCLVKMMCREACGEYFKFYNKYNEKVTIKEKKRITIDDTM